MPNIRGRRIQVLVLGIFTCTRCFRLETGAFACPRVMRATSESRLNDHGRGAIGPFYPPDDPGGETYRVSAQRSRRDAPAFRPGDTPRHILERHRCRGLALEQRGPRRWLACR